VNDIARRIQDAASDAAAGAVAPPFGAVERRARAHRTRRVGGLAAVGTLALVSVAVAFPHGYATVTPAVEPTLKPATAMTNDPAARAVLQACFDELSTPVPGRPHLTTLPNDASERCYHRAGYETPVPVQGPDPGACPRQPAGDVVAEGTAGTRRWALRATRGDDGGVCLAYTLDGRLDGTLNTGTDAAPNPSTELNLLYSLPQPYARWMIVYGSLPAGAVRAVWTVDGAAYEVPARAVPGSRERTFYGFVVRTAGRSMTYSSVAYDAAGNEVSRTAAQTLVLYE
jgi:hypothetical protein